MNEASGDPSSIEPLLRVDVITLFPELVSEVIRHGVTGRASDIGLLRLLTWNPREYTHDRHRTVDDRPYGGGPGMVMKVEPLRQAIRAAKDACSDLAPVIYLSPQGRRLDQAGIRELAANSRLILLCGRYEGVDERLLRMEVDQEWSIGDYVLSGGELPAMVMIDALARLIPGALGHEDSAAEDSFVDGVLDCPHYTRPERIDGHEVPAVLMGGNHAQIRRWRRKQALGRTWLRRPDLLERVELDADSQHLLNEFIHEYRSGSPER